MLDRKKILTCVRHVVQDVVGSYKGRIIIDDKMMMHSICNMWLLLVLLFSLLVLIVSRNRLRSFDYINILT